MKNSQKGSVVFILLIVVLVTAGFLIWGSTTNWEKLPWAKSFDDESVSRYCYTACVNFDRVKYCTPDLTVAFKADNSPNKGSKWGDTSCNDLALNNIIQTCKDIKCP